MDDNPYQSPSATDLDASLRDLLNFFGSLTLLMLNIAGSVYMLYLGVGWIFLGMAWLAVLHGVYVVCHMILCWISVKADPHLKRNLWRKELTADASMPQR